MATDRVLQVSEISKRFPGVVALDRVSLDVCAGLVVALVGENGAGKSTLMKILAGVYRPDSGEIRVGGQVVTLHKPADAARLGIGVIHQELEVVETLDVAANICLGREPLRGGPLRLLDRARMDDIAAAALARLGVRTRRGRATGPALHVRTPLRELSPAQQQLITIARALSMQVRILILDEPTSSLALDDTDRLLHVLRDLRAQGVAIVYVSHRLAEVEALADQVVVLRDGRTVGTLDRDAIDRDVVVRMMVDRDGGRETVRSWRGPCQARDGEADKPRPTGDFSLEIKDLRTRRYPGSAVSLTLRRGEILGVAGLIGSGRTEVVEAICGISPPLGGSMRLDGARFEVAAPRDAIARGIYLVPEDRRRSGLMDAATVRENITLPALRLFARAGLVRRRPEGLWAQQAATRLRVKAPSIEVAVSQLSGGNQQKVVLARWLSLPVPSGAVGPVPSAVEGSVPSAVEGSPRIVVFDEPTRGIDVGARAEIYQVMRDLAAAGTSILMVSSDIEEILDVSDRVAVMHDGRVTGILARDECTAERVMQLAVA